MNAYNHINELGLGMLFLKSFGRRDWNHGLNQMLSKPTMSAKYARWNGQLATWSYIVKQNNHTGKIDGKAWVGTRAVRLRYQSPSDITPAVCPVLMACSESAAKIIKDEKHGIFSTWSLDITWHIQCAVTPFMTHTTQKRRPASDRNNHSSSACFSLEPRSISQIMITFIMNTWTRSGHVGWRLLKKHLYNASV